MLTPSRLLPALLAALLLVSTAVRTCAADTAAAPAGSITEEFRPVFEALNAKLKAGQTTEAALVKEIAALDTLLAKYAATKTDEVAYVAFMKARLYLEVFTNADQGLILLKDIQKNFPDTEIAKQIAEIVTAVEKQQAAEKALAIGLPFPDFAEQDLDGKPLALADYKGKTVLISFWATWCSPCLREMPYHTAAYAQYHAKGFEIIGISLDSNRSALTSYIKENKMPWAQYFDGLAFQNKMVLRYGISSTPASYLLDGEGRIIAKHLRGEELGLKLAELLK